MLKTRVGMLPGGAVTGVNVGGWVWQSQKITSAQTDEIIKKGTPEKKKGGGGAGSG